MLARQLAQGLKAELLRLIITELAVILLGLQGQLAIAKVNQHFEWVYLVQPAKH